MHIADEKPSNVVVPMMAAEGYRRCSHLHINSLLQSAASFCQLSASSTTIIKLQHAQTDTRSVLFAFQTLASAPDVRGVLERRFGMLNWFKRHGYPDSLWQKDSGPVASAVPAVQDGVTTNVLRASAAAQRADMEVVIDDKRESAPVLLVFDFDQTLTNW